MTAGTSPADFLHTQHPKGGDYANYLEAIVEHFKLPVSTGIKILAVTKESEGFIVNVWSYKLAIAARQLKWGQL